MDEKEEIKGIYFHDIAEIMYIDVDDGFPLIYSLDHLLNLSLVSRNPKDSLHFQCLKSDQVSFNDKEQLWNFGVCFFRVSF